MENHWSFQGRPLSVRERAQMETAFHDHEKMQGTLIRDNGQRVPFTWGDVTLRFSKDLTVGIDEYTTSVGMPFRISHVPAFFLDRVNAEYRLMPLGDAIHDDASNWDAFVNYVDALVPGTTDRIVFRTANHGQVILNAQAVGANPIRRVLENVSGPFERQTGGVSQDIMETQFTDKEKRLLDSDTSEDPNWFPQPGLLTLRDVPFRFGFYRSPWTTSNVGVLFEGIRDKITPVKFRIRIMADPTETDDKGRLRAVVRVWMDPQIQATGEQLWIMHVLLASLKGGGKKAQEPDPNGHQVSLPPMESINIRWTRGITKKQVQQSTATYDRIVSKGRETLEKEKKEVAPVEQEPIDDSWTLQGKPLSTKERKQMKTHFREEPLFDDGFLFMDNGRRVHFTWDKVTVRFINDLAGINEEHTTKIGVPFDLPHVPRVFLNRVSRDYHRVPLGTNIHDDASHWNATVNYVDAKVSQDEWNDNDIDTEALGAMDRIVFKTSDHGQVILNAQAIGSRLTDILWNHGMDALVVIGAPLHRARAYTDQYWHAENDHPLAPSLIGELEEAFRNDGIRHTFKLDNGETVTLVWDHVTLRFTRDAHMSVEVATQVGLPLVHEDIHSRVMDQVNQRYRQVPLGETVIPSNTDWRASVNYLEGVLTLGSRQTVRVFWETPDHGRIYPTVIGASPQVTRPRLMGMVVNVHDGDTITIRDAHGDTHIRLGNIDAPELKQPAGLESGDYLRGWVLGKTVTVDVQTIDKYGRTVGIVFLNDININEKMVEAGWAWVYPKYNRDPTLYAVEKEADDAKRGLWRNPNPQQPWEFRHRR